MGQLKGGFSEGDQVGPLDKEITQEAINLFEGSAGESGPSQFTGGAAGQGNYPGGHQPLRGQRRGVRPFAVHRRRSRARDAGDQRHGGFRANVHQFCSGDDAAALRQRRLQPLGDGGPSISPPGAPRRHHHLHRRGDRNLTGSQRPESDRQDRSAEPARRHHRGGKRQRRSSPGLSSSRGLGPDLERKRELLLRHTHLYCAVVI